MIGEEKLELMELECVLDGHLEVRINGASVGPTGMSSDSGVRLKLSFNEITCGGSTDNPHAASEVRMFSKIAHTDLRNKNLTLEKESKCSLEDRDRQNLGTGWIGRRHISLPLQDPTAGRGFDSECPTLGWGDFGFRGM